MSKIALEGNASGTGTFTIASPNSNSNYTLTLPSSTGTVVVTGGAQTIEFAAGSAASPSITFTGDTNTGIFSPGADTIAFSEGGAEAMRIDSSGRVGIGTTAPTYPLTVSGSSQSTIEIKNTSGTGEGRLYFSDDSATAIGGIEYQHNGDYMRFYTNNAERMRIDSSGKVLIGATSASAAGELLAVRGASPMVNIRASSGNPSIRLYDSNDDSGNSCQINYYDNTSFSFETIPAIPMVFLTSNTERARIDSSGRFFVGTTTTTPAASNVSGAVIGDNSAGTPVAGVAQFSANGTPLYVNRTSDDGGLVRFFQGGTEEGSISVSGNTVSYNGFSGGHWTQLQEGRGYSPEILRGTVMSSIGEMCEWKSVIWTETIEHPAVPAVEAKEAVLDEEGNVAEPAVEAVKGKDAWTETFNKREAYLGNLAVGATFTEDGVTKTVVDDGNERLPKVKISDVVGDKAVYGVFQTWDEVQDMLVTSLGAFVVRIAAGITVQIGDLLESNGDGCAKVQDDDVIRSRTIGKVTSTTPSATYADGSYTVPAVLYCG